MIGILGLVPTMQAQWRRHEVLANNLANLTTPGFKRDDVAAVPGAVTPLTALGATPPPALTQWTDFSQGAVRETGRALDLALNGPGFLVVETPNGVRYTRGGALTLSREGYLVTGDGARVIGERGPVLAGTERITVSARGEVRSEGRLVDTLRVVDFPRGVRLLKEGGGLFVPEIAGADAQASPARATEVIGGALEASNVNPVETMVSMIDSLRKYEAAQRAIQAIEDANREANMEIGKV